MVTALIQTLPLLAALQEVPFQMLPGTTLESTLVLSAVSSTEMATAELTIQHQLSCIYIAVMDTIQVGP